MYVCIYECTNPLHTKSPIGIHITLLAHTKIAEACVVFRLQKITRMKRFYVVLAQVAKHFIQKYWRETGKLDDISGQRIYCQYLLNMSWYIMKIWAAKGLTACTFLICPDTLWRYERLKGWPLSPCRCVLTRYGDTWAAQSQLIPIFRLK